MPEPTTQPTPSVPGADVKTKLRDQAGPDARRIYWMNRMDVEREDGTRVTLVPTPEQLAVAIAKCSRSTTPFDQNVDDVSLEKAADFHEKWVVGYGHNSVAEHAVASVAFQNIPQTVIKILEDSRLASFTEKSSRYQVFTRDRVSVPATLATSAHGRKVADLFDHLYGLYDSLFPELAALMRGRYPKPDEMGDGAYNAATKARVCDVVRYLLPAAALGSLGMTANARTWEYVIMKLLSSPDAVARQVGRELKTVLKGAAEMDKDVALRERPLPTLLKYADPKPYLTDTPVVLEELARELIEGVTAEGRVATPNRPVAMTKDDPEAELHVAAAILTRFGGAPYAAALQRLRGDEAAIERVLRAAVDGRGSHDAPLRELEHAWFQHEIVMDYGAWRDVQRHRICTQTNQPLGTDLGYDIPEEIETIGHSGEWRYVLDEAALLHDTLVKDGFEVEAAYVVPMAYRRRMLVGWNLRELFHFIELRSGKKGHPSYRRIAQEIWRTIQETHPLLATFIRVDLSDETTSTLGAKPKGF
ncbi:MAG: FAD-dependent thymidylate synthase [Patescibacteria group bacterium]